MESGRLTDRWLAPIAKLLTFPDRMRDDKEAFLAQSSLSKTELLKLARAGASARVAELQAEIDAIYRQFPDVRKVGVDGAPAKRKPGLRGWTPAQRKAAAERMRKYWAARKGKK